MSRALWFVAGGACGVYTLVKARRTVHAFTPDGIGARVAALSAGARVFADEVAQGMAEREAELRAQLDPGPQRLRLTGSADNRRDVNQRPTRRQDRAVADVSAGSERGRDGHR